MKGVWIKELGPNLFIFQFFHELDLERVINGGPWTFEQHLLIFTKLESGMNPMQVDLYEVNFWIQVYDLPVGYMSERITWGNSYRLMPITSLVCGNRTCV